MACEWSTTHRDNDSGTSVPTKYAELALVRLHCSLCSSCIKEGRGGTQMNIYHAEATSHPPRRHRISPKRAESLRTLLLRLSLQRLPGVQGVRVEGEVQSREDEDQRGEVLGAQLECELVEGHDLVEDDSPSDDDAA